MQNQRDALADLAKKASGEAQREVQQALEKTEVKIFDLEQIFFSSNYCPF